MSKTGILLVNLGTPDEPKRGAVYRYLRQFLLDRRVIDYPWLARQLLVQGIIAPFRSGSSAKLYKELWTDEGSPLKVYGYRLQKALQQEMGEDYVVELAMRYQQPSIEEGIRNLLRKNIRKLVVFPMFPQYASATTGSVHDEVMRVLRREENIPELELINSYPTYDPMIELFADNGRQYQLETYDRILFSYHGLPERQLVKADNNDHCLKTENCCRHFSEINQFCYSAQCYATTAAIAGKLGLKSDQYVVTFQSRLGPEQWTQPYTIKVIEKLAKEGAKKLLVFCPAFVSDCLETTIEIALEYKEEFEKMGGEQLDLVESLNDNPKWIQAVKAYLLK